jgi:hypothetical protein
MSRHDIHQADAESLRQTADFMEAGERTLLKTFTNVEAAEVALARLQANGIAGYVESNDAGGTLPFLQVPEGVKLFVPSSQFDEAMELLNS